MTWCVSFRVVASCSLSGTATIVPVGTLTALLRLRDLSKLLQPISSWAFPVSSGARGTSSILRMLSKPLLPGWKLKVNQSLLGSFPSRCIILTCRWFSMFLRICWSFFKTFYGILFLNFLFLRAFMCVCLLVLASSYPQFQSHFTQLLSLIITAIWVFLASCLVKRLFAQAAFWAESKASYETRQTATVPLDFCESQARSSPICESDYLLSEPPCWWSCFQRVESDWSKLKCCNIHCFYPDSAIFLE